MTTYQITLRVERLAEGPYLGTSPDLPGLIVQADTAEQVISLAPEIARDLIEVMRENGEDLPPALHREDDALQVCLPVAA
jgi:predicted RNase H-like HicB family nuclease